MKLTASNNATANAFMGYANYGYVYGGDFGISIAPDGLTCGGAYVTATGFDHHTDNYRMLNCGCERQYLYSYASQVGDSDAGYDVNTALGSWTATNVCQSEEGGSLSFYAAMR